jgi:D-alanyl-D-alanine carboxypeptidase
MSIRLVLTVLVAAPMLLGAAFDVDRQNFGADACPSQLVIQRGFPVTADDVFAQQLPDAEALLLFDRTTGVAIVERDADSLRIVASTVKILTALTVVRHVAQDELVVVSPAAARSIGASIGLRAGQQYPVGVLLAGMLVRSGNDAAIALAEHVAGDVTSFVALMRQEAELRGVASASVDDPSGLADSNRLSARQLAVLADVALADPVLGPLLKAADFRLNNGPISPNRNLLIGRFDGATGVKTGFTTRAGHAVVASAKRGHRDLIAVVLSAGSEQTRFDRAEQLLTYGFQRTAVHTVSSELAWTNIHGVTSWALPSTTVLSSSDPVSVRWSLPTTPADVIHVDLLMGQERYCQWRSAPKTYRDDASLSMGEAIRGIVGQGLGTALFAETSGSLRVPVQGGRS